jgi:hypothetical protein
VHESSAIGADPTTMHIIAMHTSIFQKKSYIQRGQRDGKIALPKRLEVFVKTEKYYSIKKLQYFSLCAKILQFCNTLVSEKLCFQTRTKLQK